MVHVSHHYNPHSDIWKHALPELTSQASWCISYLDCRLTDIKKEQKSCVQPQVE